MGSHQWMGHLPWPFLAAISLLYKELPGASLELHDPSARAGISQTVSMHQVQGPF